MNTKVLDYGGLTKLALHPDKILENQKGKYQRVIVIGITDDEEIQIASSEASLIDVSFDLDRAKWWIMNEVMAK